MTTRGHINPYELDTEVDLGVDTQADTALPETGLSLDSMTEKLSVPFVLQFPQSQDVRKKSTNKVLLDKSSGHFTGEVINEQDQERFYTSFIKDGEEYTLDESILVTSPNKKLPTIGQIHCLWEDKKTGKRIIECKVYYRPEETKEGRKPFQAPKELLDSNYFAQFTIDQVVKKCSVESYEQFRRRREFPEDVYYFQDFYDYREQQTVLEVPQDNFSFRRRIVNVALNTKSPKSKDQQKSKVNGSTNNNNNNNNTKVNTKAIEVSITKQKTSKNSQQSTQKQNKGSDSDDEATLKLTMPPIDDDYTFDFGVIEELAGSGPTTNNNTAKNSTNIQDASTLITTQRDVTVIDRKKSPSLSDDETTSGGSEKRAKIASPKKKQSSESSTSSKTKNEKNNVKISDSGDKNNGSKGKLSAASRTRSKRNEQSSPVVSSSLMTEDSEDVIMKELELEEEEVTQAKARTRITRQASTMATHAVGKSKARDPSPKKKQQKDEDSGEDYEEEEKSKPKTRGRPKKTAAKKQESDEEISLNESEEEKPKPKPKTRGRPKKSEVKKPDPVVVAEASSDEEETAILEAIERETEELNASRKNSAKKKLRAYAEGNSEDEEKSDISGPSSPTKLRQAKSRAGNTKGSTATKSSKSAFEFEGSDSEKSAGESPRKARAARRLSVASNDSKTREKKPPVIEDVHDNEDSIEGSDSEEKKKWTSPRKNKGPASKREKIKEMLQNYPKLSELDTNDPFESSEIKNEKFDINEPVAIDVDKFNSRTMKRAIETEDNDFELDNFLKDRPKRPKSQMASLFSPKNDFSSRLGALSNKMKYYQNWEIVGDNKEVIDIDEDSNDSKMRNNSNNSNNNSLGSASKVKNRSAQMKLDFAPATDKSTSNINKSLNNDNAINRKSSNNSPLPVTKQSSKVKPSEDPFINSILSKYGDDDKEVIDLSTQKPSSANNSKVSKNGSSDDEESSVHFGNDVELHQETTDFNEYDVESMLRVVEELGGDDSSPKKEIPVISVDDSSLDKKFKSNKSSSGGYSKKRIDTSPSSEPDSDRSENSNTNSKKRKRNSDEKKQRTLGTLNIIGAPAPSISEPPKKKRRLSEHIDRIQKKLRYKADEEEVFVDKEDEEMDDELRDFIVDDNAELSQYDSLALPIDALADEEEDNASVRDEPESSQNSVKDLADKLTKEGETKFLSTTFKMSDAFKIFIQYLVSCMLDPQFASEVERKQDDYFRPAVRKIHDDLFSRKEVIIRSSAWNAAFKAELDQLPVFRSYKLNHPEGECDACKRSMHTASWQIVLEGVPYDVTTYWKDGPTKNNPSKEREPVQYTYNLGRFCHKRTDLFHRLHHYKRHLNDQLADKLNSLPSSLSENEVIDTILDDELWINRLWKQFLALREEAFDFGAKGGEDG